MMSKISKFKIKTGFDLVLARPSLPRLNRISARDPGGVTACLFKEFIITLYKKKRPQKHPPLPTPQPPPPHRCLEAQVPHAAGVRAGGPQPAPPQRRVSFGFRLAAPAQRGPGSAHPAPARARSAPGLCKAAPSRVASPLHSVSLRAGGRPRRAGAETAAPPPHHGERAREGGEGSKRTGPGWHHNEKLEYWGIWERKWHANEDPRFRS